MQDDPDSARPARPIAGPDRVRLALVRGARAGRSGGTPMSGSPGARAGVWAGGSDAPEKTDLAVGFIPLTDCAPVLVAAAKGFDRRHGIRITPTREASWAALRDKLVYGALDAAHALYGLVYGVHLGANGPREDMAVLLTLNRNGQGITLASALRDAGVTDGAALARAVAAGARRYTFAQTFPTGTHAMWLYYWLAAHGIHPFEDVKTIVVPPPQMVASLRAARMDGCCVGEPWNARAIHDEVGFTVATSQALWPDHPEKVLAATAAFVERHPNTARALTAALLDACRWCDDPAHHAELAALLAAPEHVACPAGVIEGRLSGRYHDGLGRRWTDPHPLRFFDDGAVTFPWLSDGMWFLTQQYRWGLLAQRPDFRAVAGAVNRADVYAQAAAAAGVAVPAQVLRGSRLFDGQVWDGTDPEAYAASFTLRARTSAAA